MVLARGRRRRRGARRRSESGLSPAEATSRLEKYGPSAFVAAETEPRWHALQKMMIVKAKVGSGGELLEVPAEQLVSGDVVSIEAGDVAVVPETPQPAAN
jgi:hypothetical protein